LILFTWVHVVLRNIHTRRVELIICCNKGNYSSFNRHSRKNMSGENMSDEDLFLELRERGRSVTRTPTSQRRRKHAPPRTPAQRGRSRSRPAQPRMLRFKSPSNKAEQYHREAVSLLSRPKDERTKFDIYHLNKGKSLDQIDRMWERRKSGKYKLKTRKVRHNNARTVLKKMPARGKPYAKGRKSMKKPKGAYRGAVMPRWAKGETKHILVNDNCGEDIAASVTGVGSALSPTTGVVDRDHGTTGENSMHIGELKAFCLNPIEQGTHQRARNGRSVDGTYLRVQGHIRNSHALNKAYVRMLVLAVKGGVGNLTNADTTARMGAPFVQSQLYKRIDGTVTGFKVPTGVTTTVNGVDSVAATGEGAAAVRTLQLPVNKSLYTVLYDQKMQLASTGESFGSSDRLFDAKIALKQRTQYGSGLADAFEKNQLVFVVMTVDPTCSDAIPAGDDIKLEFESKYSYKDF